VLNQFDEHTRKHIEELVSNGNTIDSRGILVEIMICAQKIIQETQEIINNLSKKNVTGKITKLLILSMQIELLYKTIQQIRREYTL
jgi:hypothetical protein